MKRDVVRLFFLCFLFFSALQSKDLFAADLVVHRALHQQEITRHVARLIFTMRLLRWSDGTPVTVFVLDDTDSLHRQFTKQVLDLYPRQLRRVWDRNLFSGSGAVPVTVDSVDEMIRWVDKTPGAIGYLPSGYATEAVKVIHVEK